VAVVVIPPFAGSHGKHRSAALVVAVGALLEVPVWLPTYGGLDEEWWAIPAIPADCADRLTEVGYDACWTLAAPLVTAGLCTRRSKFFFKEDHDARGKGSREEAEVKGNKGPRPPDYAPPPGARERAAREAAEGAEPEEAEEPAESEEQGAAREEDEERPNRAGSFYDPTAARMKSTGDPIMDNAACSQVSLYVLFGGP
jgi:hypothetical protein